MKIHLSFFIISRSRDEPVRKPKDALIYDVLKRWWYALPDWPPANYDYQPSLEANKLRLISKQKFRIAPDLDEKGTHKLKTQNYNFKY